MNGHIAAVHQGHIYKCLLCDASFLKSQRHSGAVHGGKKLPEPKKLKYNICNGCFFLCRYCK